MPISQLFRKAAITQPSQFKPKCDDCQKYRNLIARAHHPALIKLLRADFEAHVVKEHTHAVSN